MNVWHHNVGQIRNERIRRATGSGRNIQENAGKKDKVVQTHNEKRTGILETDCGEMDVLEKRRKGRRKRRWMDSSIKGDLRKKGLSDDKAQDWDKMRMRTFDLNKTNLLLLIRHSNLNIIELTMYVCRYVAGRVSVCQPTPRTADVTVTKIAGYVRVCILMNQ